MSLLSCFGLSSHSRTHGFASAVLAVFVALTWNDPAFCDEIHDAAVVGNLAKVKALLRDNPTVVFSKDKAGYGSTALQIAAQYGHMDIVELLLANNAEVNARNIRGYTALHYAAMYGHKDIVELLLNSKADVNAKDNDGGTPLDLATSHREVAELLRRHGGQASADTLQPTRSVPAIKISTDGSGSNKVFLAGEISIGAELSVTETKLFTVTPAQLFKKGDKVAAMLSDDQAWSVDTQALEIGANQVAYPILAMVKASDGFHSLLPAILRAKADIKPGGILHSDGYRIETKRAVSAGQPIPVLLVGDSFLSVEAAQGVTDKGKAEPWFAAYRDDTKTGDVAALIEAWRVENEHVRK